MFSTLRFQVPEQWHPSYSKQLSVFHNYLQNQGRQYLFYFSLCSRSYQPKSLFDKELVQLGRTERSLLTSNSNGLGVDGQNAQVNGDSVYQTQDGPQKGHLT
jgi:hypothetical protein